MQRLDRAVLVTDRGEQTVDLPYKLTPGDVPSGGGRVRFRLALSLPQVPESDLAVFVSRLSLSGTLRINGHSAGACAPASLEEARCLHQPQLWTTGASLWRAGVNELELEVYANSRQTNGLSRVVVGPVTPVEARWAWRHFWQVDVLQGLTWALGTIALLMLGVALVQGDRGVYLIFGLAGLLNAVCNLNLIVMVPPVGADLYSWFVFASRLASIPLIVLSMLSFFGQDGVRERRWLVATSLVLPVVVWWSDNSLIVVQMLYLPFVPLSLWSSLACMRWARQSGQGMHATMAAVYLATVVASLWDYARLLGVAAFDTIYVLPYAYTLTLLFMGVMLVGLMLKALRAQRDLAAVLERKVAEREAELRSVYDQMMLLEQSRVRTEEREALLAHMHDGLGSQLTSARVLLSSGELAPKEAAEVLRECSDDLRLVIQTLGQGVRSLEEAVADYRHRLSRRLGTSGHQLHWYVRLADMPKIERTALLQIMRVIQEASQNALRHAGALELQFHLVWAPALGDTSGLLTVTVADNGEGFDPALTTHGHGLRNLRSRADALGAQLDIQSGPEGTQVRLRWSPPQNLASG